MGWGGRALEAGSPVYQSRQETARTAVASVERADTTNDVDGELLEFGEEVSKRDCQVCGDHLSLVGTSCREKAVSSDLDFLRIRRW